MKYSYKTKGTCCSKIDLDINGDIITNVSFQGGCNGNLKAIPILVDGMTVEAIEKKCKGITCGFRSTSCADQLARAVREAYNSANSQ